MIEAMVRWNDYNGFSSWYTACVRVGYDPNAILKRAHEVCARHSLPSLLIYPGERDIEGCGGFEAVNEILLQSHEGELRFFPVWPKDQNARFGNLRAVGAFLVSAKLKNGIVTGVKIVGEKGRPCTAQNPWTGKRVTVKTKPGEIIDLKPE